MARGLTGSQNPFFGCDTYQTFAHLPAAERARRMADPATKAAILSEDPRKNNTFPLFHRLSFDFMFRFGNPPNYTPDPKDSAAAIPPLLLNNHADEIAPANSKTTLANLLFLFVFFA